MYIEKTLKNGVRFVGKADYSMRSVSIGIWVRAGSVNEKAQENGLSHFLEHMFFKGTEKRSAKTIAMDMDKIGANINAFTAKECTCFYVSAVDENLPEALDCLMDIFTASSFDETELEREKGVVLEEIAMAWDTPDDVAHEMAACRFFEGTPLGQTILGPAENIRNAKREDLVYYKKSHYRPENIVISAVGNFCEEELFSMLEEGMKKLETVPAEDSSFDYSTWKPKSGFYSVEKEIEQAHICISFPGIAYEDDRKYALSVISNALGGSMSSRLFQKIREEMGMAYSVYSYSSAYTDAGMFTLYAGTSQENAEEVTKLMLAECRDVAENGISDEEFERSKAQLRGGFILSTESGQAIMNSIGKAAVMGKGLVTEDMLLAKLENVDKETVREVAKEVFGSGIVSVVYVGKGGKELEKLFI